MSVKVNVSGLTAKTEEGSVTLTNLESKILGFIGEEVVSTRDIKNHCYSDAVKEAPTDDHIRMMVSKIRKKLKSIGAEDFISTVRGKGYVRAS